MYEPDSTSGWVLLTVGLGTETVFSGQVVSPPQAVELPNFALGTFENVSDVINPNLYISSAVIFNNVPVSPTLPLSVYADGLISRMDSGVLDQLRSGEFASPPPPPQQSPPPPSGPLLTG